MADPIPSPVISIRIRQYIIGILSPHQLPRSWPVDRAFRAHQKGDEILDLLDRQHCIGAKTGHQRAGESRVRVVDLVIGSLRLSLRKLSDLAVLEKARTHCAIAHLFIRELVTSVAIATVFPCRWIVGKAKTIAALRETLALFPIANQLAVGRILDSCAFARRDGTGDLSWWRVPRF